MAYDYATDTYYVGGTNDAAVYHVDGSGNLLDSAYVGIGMTGLAYNPGTRHLFVASEFPSPFNVWVLDPQHAYTILGGFVVSSGGVSVLQGESASLEADCDGHLRAIDPSSQVVYEFESGETGWCVNDIPWLSETPEAGTVPSGGSLPVTVTFDSSSLLPGLRLGIAPLRDGHAGPGGSGAGRLHDSLRRRAGGQLRVELHLWRGRCRGHAGCAPQTPTFLFCPAEVVTRRSMAGFIERAVHGALAPPPVYLGEFGDVLPGSFNANYIQGLVDDAITAGCGGGNYCPDVPVTRAQMAVFVWKGQHGSEPPPACTPPGTFADVPCPGGFAVDYIEGIAAEGVTAGCGNGNYCPNASITNAQMAVFMVKAFQHPVPAMRTRMKKQEGTAMNPLKTKTPRGLDPLCPRGRQCGAPGGARLAPARDRRSDRRGERHRHGRVGSRLAALRAHRDHVGLDRAGRGRFRTPSPARTPPICRMPRPTRLP